VTIKRVLVVGAGLMGGGIAQVTAVAGYEVMLKDVSMDAVEKALANIAWSLGKLVEKEKLTAADRDAALRRIAPTLDLNAATTADFCIEAIFEDKARKQEVFRELDQLCPAHAILASNSSAIPTTEMAKATNRPDRVVGTHFFSPVPLMPVCEIIRGLETSEETLATTREFIQSLGKETITVRRDVAGFVLNRINLPANIEAIRLVEAGVVTCEEVDRGMRLGMGRRMGPFETMDMTGLDVSMGAMMAVYEETKDPRFWPPDLLRRKVASGQLGRKRGRGWYTYDAAPGSKA
jgi:3-hydroxybutyryl-CoA dehydrogenase